MGRTCRKHDSSCGIFFPGIQSALRSLLCSDGSDQKRDEQCKMVLVCSRLSDIVGVCCFSLCLPDWNLDYYRNIWYRHSSRMFTCDWIYVSACTSI